MINSSKGPGTAFVVAVTKKYFYLVTAAHNLTLKDSVYSLSSGFYSNEYKAYPYRPFTEGADLAIVRAERDLLFESRALKILNGVPVPGTRVYAGGYPGGADFKMLDGGEVVKIDKDRIMLSGFEITGGFSGAPVLRESDHKVVGIVLKGTTDALQYKAYADPINVIYETIENDPLMQDQDRSNYSLDILDFYSPYLNFLKEITAGMTVDEIKAKLSTHNRDRDRVDQITDSRTHYTYIIEQFPSTQVVRKGNSTVHVEYSFAKDALTSLKVKYIFYHGLFKTSGINRSVNAKMISNRLNALLGDPVKNAKIKEWVLPVASDENCAVTMMKIKYGLEVLVKINR